MIKIRVTFEENIKGNEELEEIMKHLEVDYKILNKSKVYKGRGCSVYSNIYIDVEKNIEVEKYRGMEV